VTWVLPAERPPRPRRAARPWTIRRPRRCRRARRPLAVSAGPLAAPAAAGRRTASSAPARRICTCCELPFFSFRVSHFETIVPGVENGGNRLVAPEEVAEGPLRAPTAPEDAANREARSRADRLTDPPAGWTRLTIARPRPVPREARARRPGSCSKRWRPPRSRHLVSELLRRSRCPCRRRRAGVAPVPRVPKGVLARFSAITLASGAKRH
jgi:hypothetical protein